MLRAYQVVTLITSLLGSVAVSFVGVSCLRLWFGSLVCVSFASLVVSLIMSSCGTWLRPLFVTLVVSIGCVTCSVSCCAACCVC